MGAISAGWAARPKTVCEPNCLTFSLGKVEGISEADDGRFSRCVGDEIRTRIERLD